MRNRSGNTATSVHQTTSSTTEEFGLVGWLEKTRIRLPLKGVECRFEVCGDVASVEIEQIFHQANQAPINCTYTFPLPGNAAVYKCTVQIGERTIIAKVEKLEKARAAFKEKVRAGHRAGLVELQRDNLFTLSLGNLQPQDVIVVKLSYFQTVDRIDELVSVLIPFCPGVRYIPGKPLWRDSKGKGAVGDTDQVPDASLLTPPRMSAQHEDAAYVNIEGSVHNNQVDVSSLASPMHRIIASTDEGSEHISIDMDSAIPDRDFILRWTEKPVTAAAANAWVCELGGETFALVQLKAPEEVRLSDDYEQDNYFLIDRSGSMAGEKWVKTAQALREFVHKLGRKDRVWISFFESAVQDFSERPLLKRELLEDRNFAAIEQRGTGGGTELLPAIRHVLAKATEFSFNKNRRANLILITDGQVGNEEAVIAALQPYPQFLTHAFGIDTTVNDAFLRSLTRQQRGQVVFQTPADDISGAVASLGGKLRRPVVTDVQVGRGWELAETRARDLCAGDILNLTLRKTQKDAPLALAGRLPDGQVFRFNFAPVATTNPAVKLLWIKNRIVCLLDANQDAEAIQLAIKNNLLCRGTAFIAWDEKEKVAVAAQEIYQPSLEVHDTIFCLNSPVAGMTCVGSGDWSAPSRLSLKQMQVHGSPMPPNDSSLLYDAGRETLMADFGALPLFQSTLGEKLLEELAAWAGLIPSKTKSRQNALKKLLADLLRHLSDLEKCRDICRRFVQKQVAGDKQQIGTQALLEMVAKL